MANSSDEHLQRTRAQIEQRQDMGDRLEVPRLVEHNGQFKGKAAAHDAAAELEALGYTVTVAKAGLRRFQLEAAQQ